MFFSFWGVYFGFYYVSAVQGRFEYVLTNGDGYLRRGSPTPKPNAISQSPHRDERCQPSREIHTKLDFRRLHWTTEYNNPFHLPCRYDGLPMDRLCYSCFALGCGLLLRLCRGGIAGSVHRDDLQLLSSSKQGRDQDSDGVCGDWLGLLVREPYRRSFDSGEGWRISLCTAFCWLQHLTWCNTATGRTAGEVGLGTIKGLILTGHSNQEVFMSMQWWAVVWTCRIRESLGSMLGNCNSYQIGLRIAVGVSNR